MNSNLGMNFSGILDLTKAPKTSCQLSGLSEGEHARTSDERNLPCCNLSELALADAVAVEDNVARRGRVRRHRPLICQVVRQGTL